MMRLHVRVGTVLAGLAMQAALTSLVAAEITVSADGVITAVFQNRAGGYDRAVDTANKDRFEFGKIGKQRSITFRDLGRFTGRQGIEVLSAELRLYYCDEWWTNKIYHVSATSLRGSAGSTGEAKPDSVAVIYGDKTPRKVKTPRPSWVVFKLSSATAQQWIVDEKSNHGITVRLFEVGYVGDERTVPTLIRFRGCATPKAEERPQLVIRYRAKGNLPPTMPVMDAMAPSWKVCSPVSLNWKSSFDPNNDPVKYEFEVGHDVEGKGRVWRKASARVEGTIATWSIGDDAKGIAWPAGTPESEKKLWYRVRAVDARGETSAWNEKGPVLVTNRTWEVWGLHGNRKVWPKEAPLRTHGTGVKIQSAKNEWESFQLAVTTHDHLKGVKLVTTELTDGRGHRIPRPTVYAQRLLPIYETPNKWGRLGFVPDALAPLVHPVTGKPTGGKYGIGSGDIPAGRNQAFWFDLFVSKDVPAGTYRGSVTVTADGVKETVTLPVELEVFDFVLPSPKHLVATFQTGRGSIIASHSYVRRAKDQADPKEARLTLARRYEEMLHEHHINNWSPLTGWNYGLNGAKVTVEDRKVKVDWTDFDETVTPYMDGSAFKDKVPAQWLFVPYWVPVMKPDKSGWAPRLKGGNYESLDEELLAQYVREVHKHFKAKGWLDRAYYFVIDEPFVRKWKYGAFLKIARIVRKEAPGLRIFITAVHRDPKTLPKYIAEPLDPYVDVWDPVNVQVMRGIYPMDFYRQRKKEGKFDIWCQTLQSAARWRMWPNLFPEFDMPSHRIWGWLSWRYGFQGIEWWSTIMFWNNKTRVAIDIWNDPMGFPAPKPMNCDGRMFYPGTEEALGGPDIPVSSLRMKAVRETVEDYEYIYLLSKRVGEKKADEIVASMYTRDKAESKLMRMPISLGPEPFDKYGAEVAQWWEGDPDAMLEARERIARLIEAALKKTGNR